MSCTHFREMLIDQFGQSDLTSELTGHLEICAECRRVWEELRGLQSEMGANTDSFPSAHESERVARLVDEQILRETQTTDLRRVSWFRYAAVAATVAIVSISTVVWKMSGNSALVVTGVDTVGQTIDSTTTDTEEDFSVAAVATLLEDYAGHGSFTAGENLLGDLTDEEAAYLESKMSVGDIL